MLAASLRRDRHDLIEVENGLQLLELVSDRLRKDESLPDVIVSDVRMPGQTGLEVLASLRRADATIPVILITAFGDPELHAEARRLGVAAIFDKPFDIDDLKQAIHACDRGAETARVVRVHSK
jgi:CheY-like chemotaxis protein